MYKIDVVGLGAIGAAYGAVALERGNSEIRVLVDDQRYASYEDKTMTVNGIPCKFNTVSPSHREGAFEGPADLMIIACKFTGLEASLDVAEAFIGKDTIVLTVLNGLLSEEVAIARFGPARVIHSFCMGIDTVKSGDKVDYSNIGKIFIGSVTEGPLDPRVQRVREIFEAAGIPHEVPEDILKMMWKKFAINVSGNQLSAVLELTYGWFHKDEDLDLLLIEVMREVIRLARAKGINLTESAIDEYREVIKMLDPNGKTSMYQDIEAGRKTEVELFAGHVLKMGEALGLEMPYNRMLYHLIRIKERQLGVNN